MEYRRKARQYRCMFDKNPPIPDPRPRRVYMVFALHSWRWLLMRSVALESLAELATMRS